MISGAIAGGSPDFSIREINQWYRQILGASMRLWEDFLNVMRLVWQKKVSPHIYRTYT
ncbi:hypothetical protein GCM10011391_02100 [Pullulanibacillus camelliae]|uniref:Uncharacterized protein n=1 Tax=Pullulanibacillus camelliae TaxID=1707096 RepID=A0A8J2YB95_9BACL|nr:hypothetical protein GCM10011391_02100 [Pullulanibacillus camelliae]